MSKRKTTQDYKQEYEDHLLYIEGIKARVLNRLIFLCKEYPDAEVIILRDGTIVKAKTISSTTFLNGCDINVHFTYIEAIEKWLSEKENVQQLEINF